MALFVTQEIRNVLRHVGAHPQTQGPSAAPGPSRQQLAPLPAGEPPPCRHDTLGRDQKSKLSYNCDQNNLLETLNEILHEPRERMNLPIIRCHVTGQPPTLTNCSHWPKGCAHRKQRSTTQKQSPEPPL
jgi:hypothetical protein